MTDFKVSTVASYSILIDALINYLKFKFFFCFRKNYSEVQSRSLTIFPYLYSHSSAIIAVGCQLFCHHFTWM